MMIGEVGTAGRGAAKAAWIKDALNAVPRRYPDVKALVWFDKVDDEMNWPIESSGAASSAFAARVRQPAYLGNSFGGLSPGPVPPPG